ncbi:SDR family oxidoreductase [Xanthovirga aplysinae]|uniref:SDR family oxidoreductase n=1 Tax=Xanthovirga aplysinae TaxID=2529853 RepID=UPI0012BBAA68|nr:SDR family oxidoreductase [Xanthovirga aplysinae]MTI30913.1 SDR family oxidoreductase [Xanthovirga aplysinae]
MKVFLTGANGLLGQKLVQLLASDPQIELIASGRGPSRLPQIPYTYKYITVDICKEEEVIKVMDTYSPDAIINTAAMTNVDQCEENRTSCWKNNVEAVKYLIKAAESCGAYFQHVSTDFIFDGTAGPYEETAVAQPVNYYGESKLAAEELVKTSKLSWSIIRTVLVYGLAYDMSRSNIILWVKNSLEKNKEIQVVTDQWRTPTLAEDLAQGCYLALKNQAIGIYHISGKDFLTPYEMAIKTADFFQLDKSLIKKANSSNFKQPALRPPRTGFIIKKAIKELGYAPHSFDEGIAILSEQLITH